ncbi:MAG TPA: hypothetical protein VFC60_02630 [Tissierellaceae bacterium]|nr:hypothetical protein [Tissierellaceae bacterium]
MKKYYKYIIAVIILLIALLLVNSHLDVSGGEIEGVKEITSKSTATVEKRDLSRGSSLEYELNEEQIERLKGLILETDFRIDLSNKVFFDDNDHYWISINSNNQKSWLGIRSLGGEYISVFNQFNDKHLKIKNPNWKESLEEILSLTK